MNLARRHRRGFTLFEAMLAISLAAAAGAAMLLGTTSALQTSDEALKQVIAAGMAQQLMDEALGCMYCAKGVTPYDSYLGCSVDEDGGQGRERYNDIDDFHNVRYSPPADPYGIALGNDDGLGGVRPPELRAPEGIIGQWRQEVDVYYVAPPDLSIRRTNTNPSDYRAVEVRTVELLPGGGRRELASLKRVVVYVPPLP